MNDWLIRMGNICFRHRGLLLPIAIVLLLLPSPQLSARLAWIGMLGFLVALFGQIIRSATIGLAYIIRGGKDHRVYAEGLVTQGMYAHCRNPMYFANAFLLAGLALASNSWVFVLVGVPLVLFMHRAIVAAEEAFLRGKFGIEYEEYCQRVPRWIPRLRGLGTTFRSMRFDWHRVLVQEYAAPFDWLAAIAAITILNVWRAGILRADVGIIAVMGAVIVARWVLSRVARAAKRRNPVAVGRA